MKLRLQNPLLVVADMERSRNFYKTVLDLKTVSDFGANVVLEGGLSLQTLDSWAGFLGKTPEEISFGGGSGEVYFETRGFDGFLRRLFETPSVELVHAPLEHRWGQRVVRLYDPDRHVIEVGEAISDVCRRFRDSGLDEEGIARRMDVPVEYVREQLKMV